MDVPVVPVVLVVRLKTLAFTPPARSSGCTATRPPCLEVTPWPQGEVSSVLWRAYARTRDHMLITLRPHHTHLPLSVNPFLTCKCTLQPHLFILFPLSSSSTMNPHYLVLICFPALALYENQDLHRWIYKY